MLEVMVEEHEEIIQASIFLNHVADKSKNKIIGKMIIYNTGNQSDLTNGVYGDYIGLILKGPHYKTTHKKGYVKNFSRKKKSSMELVRLMLNAIFEDNNKEHKHE